MHASATSATAAWREGTGGPLLDLRMRWVGPAVALVVVAGLAVVALVVVGFVVVALVVAFAVVAALAVGR